MALLADAVLWPNPAGAGKNLGLWKPYEWKPYEVDPDNWRTGGLWVLRAVVAFGWSRYPDDATRWTFDR